MENNENRADAKWDVFEEMMENKAVFTVPIDESVKAGVVTSLKGVRAFIPASQLSTSYVEDVNEWIGKEIDVVIITADRDKQRSRPSSPTAHLSIWATASADWSTSLR